MRPGDQGFQPRALFLSMPLCLVVLLELLVSDANSAYRVGPRHEVVARLGRLDGTEQKAARSWHDLDALPEGRRLPEQLEFGRHGPELLWRDVDLMGLHVERVRRFGRVYLGLGLRRRLNSTSISRR